MLESKSWPSLLQEQTLGIGKNSTIHGIQEEMDGRLVQLPRLAAAVRLQLTTGWIMPLEVTLGPA